MTTPMPDYLREVLERRADEIVLFDYGQHAHPAHRSDWYGAKWELAGWPRFASVLPPDPMKIIITDVA